MTTNTFTTNSIFCLSLFPVGGRIFFNYLISNNPFFKQFFYSEKNNVPVFVYIPWWKQIPSTYRLSQMLDKNDDRVESGVAIKVANVLQRKVVLQKT